MWVLENKRGLSGRAASALNHGAISHVPLHFLKDCKSQKIKKKKILSHLSRSAFVTFILSALRLFAEMAKTEFDLIYT